MQYRNETEGKEDGTEFLKNACPRLRELAPRPVGRLGSAWLGITQPRTSLLEVLCIETTSSGNKCLTKQMEGGRREVREEGERKKQEETARAK